jgi:hypothetical protein
MIPKESTPIKNNLLIDIFAKGLLTKEEMRIVFYIIRWSWGFDGVERRQDWTKELTKRQIANDIEMYESHVNANIKRMITENKIIIKDGCYQFNEHYEKWKNLPKREVSNNGKKLTERVNKTYRKGKFNLPKREVELTEKVSLDTPNNVGDSIKNKDIREGEHSFKETNKETNKETIKKSVNFINTLNEFKKMRNKNKKKMTDYAIKLLINKLNKLSNDENVQIAILNQSIMNSWQGVFPLKDEPKMTQEEALAKMEVNENE